MTETFTISREPLAGCTRRMSLEERYERAFAKVRTLRLRALRLSENRYQVRSQRAGHDPHVVEITARGLLCDCEAAQAGQPCCHAACVSLRLSREHKIVVLAEAVETDDVLFRGEDVSEPLDACAYCGVVRRGSERYCAGCYSTFPDALIPPVEAAPAPVKRHRSLETMFENSQGYEHIFKAS